VSTLFSPPFFDTNFAFDSFYVDVYLLPGIIPGFLALASPTAAFAIFAMTTVALDLSYVIPIACRRIFANHPEVMFKPGPFYMGDGFLGL
jgi:hypothetical protein